MIGREETEGVTTLRQDSAGEIVQTNAPTGTLSRITIRGEPPVIVCQAGAKTKREQAIVENVTSHIGTEILSQDGRGSSDARGVDSEVAITRLNIAPEDIPLAVSPENTLLRQT